MRNIGQPAESKMADGVSKGVQYWVIGRCDQLLQNNFFDPSTPSMRKGCDIEKNGNKNEKQAGAELCQAVLKLFWGWIEFCFL